MEKDIIGRWYDIEHGMQKTYLRPIEIHNCPDYVGIVGTIVGTVVKHDDELITFGTVYLSFKLTDFASTFVEENVVNSKVVYECFDKYIKKFSQTF